jgi:hypothetical protein
LPKRISTAAPDVRANPEQDIGSAVAIHVGVLHR